jgi:hypothetical protein
MQLFAIVGLFFAIWGIILILRAKRFEKLSEYNFFNWGLQPIAFRIIAYVVGGLISLFGLFIFFSNVSHKPI